METATPIILGISVIIAFLIFCWVFIAAWHDEILDSIAKIKPFNAKAVHKRNVREAKRDRRHNAGELKRLIRNERNQIKDKINNNIGYCYIDIIFDDNFEWLEKKGFKITETNDRAEYRISWGDTKNDP